MAFITVWHLLQCTDVIYDGTAPPIDAIYDGTASPMRTDVINDGTAPPMRTDVIYDGMAPPMRPMAFMMVRRRQCVPI